MPAQPVFDDRMDWFSEDAPFNTVLTPSTGTVIEVKNQSPNGWYMDVQVRREAPGH